MNLIKKVIQVVKDNLLIELFTEELPPDSLESFSQQFGEAIASELISSNLVTRSDFQTFATPRRIAVKIKSVKDEAEDEEKLIKLMPYSVGFDENNKPTQPLIKKISSIDEAIKTEDLEIKEDKGQKFIYVTKKLKGLKLEDSLNDIINNSIQKLAIKKVMSYQLKDGWTSVNFARPMRSLIVLHGKKVLNASVLGCKSSNTTRGHRFESNKETIIIKHADDYEKTLESDGNVIACFNNRKTKIKKDIKDTLTKLGKDFFITEDEALIDEVTSLVEMPNILIGNFEDKYLSIPEECLTLTMKTNQKYFPIFNKNDGLTNSFIIISNISPKNSNQVIHGNEKVIRPRLADAEFFYDEDKKLGLTNFCEKLKNVIYHHKLGSQKDRTERVNQKLQYLTKNLNLEFNIDLMELSLFSKADLLSLMVGEFPKLQGIMGRYYALNENKNESFANAIEDHYKPRFSNDSLPRDELGFMLAIADKFTTLIDLFSINEIPTGEKDPFGLRRNAIGVIRIIIEKKLPVNLNKLIDDFIDKNDSARISLTNFLYERLFNYLKDLGYSNEIVDALISSRPEKIYDILERLEAISEFVKLKESETLSSANKRVSNILKKADKISINPIDENLLIENEEIMLHKVLLDLEPKINQCLIKNDFISALKNLVILNTPINNFFEKVMVNADNSKIKNNRYSLLFNLRQNLNCVADISKLAS
ncbi:glycine--tRNA ligase subunit beta [Methylophilales bacterium]|nr:glycine--tRNA ligase subunit beta [Methylophilales bacterium]